MSAASQALRITHDPLEVVAVERSRWTSYSACGIPYWIAGDVDRVEALVARTPEKHRDRGIDVRLGVEAVDIDVDRQRVHVRGDRNAWIGYDDVLIATGARPRRPDIPGIHAPGVLGVQTLDEGQRVIDSLAGQRDVSTVVVTGAGYVGVEMAEALRARGLEVTVLQRSAEPMSSLDPDIGRSVREALKRLGAQIVCEAEVSGFETAADGWVDGVVADGETYPADLVVLGLGVEPAADLAADAGLPLGEAGGIRTDQRMVVADGVWAAGDCVETLHRVTSHPAFVPLGTHANKQGRVAGTNIGGGEARFPGVVGTAITRVGDLEVARTGLSQRQAEEAGIDALCVTVEATTIAGYMPEAEPMRVKLVATPGEGRLLGAQIVGGSGAAKRIDVCAMALWTSMTAADLLMTDLAYAPPFSGVWDPVQIAAKKLVGRL
jgi:NADPH-dependent 2,4-dienoyl-CoA reductase/sulfur reductase-like enzyme